ncbi:MAG TPA: sigma-70 family RNA polymerase sigma factor [Thermoleophilaceae bacterium]|nr:sigma-70 family RNA polymerase sigma factor [Thermoleophilaceae bacterium]
MREGDFERLFSDHAAPLFGFLVYRTGDRALAEDLLADTFERALTTRARLDRRRGTEKAWLYTIALNLLRDHARRAAVEERALERIGADPGTDDRSLEAVEARDEAMKLMGALEPEEREAVALRYGAELTVPEIARVLDVPLTTAESRLYRALRRMRQHGDAT